jgi:hypothetical protein
VKKEQSEMTSNLDNYKDMLRERGELAALLKKIEARIKELDADLRPVLEGRGEVVAEGYSFKVTMQAGRRTVDKPALDAFLLENGRTINEFEKSGAPFTVMTVREVTSV